MQPCLALGLMAPCWYLEIQLALMIHHDMASHGYLQPFGRCQQASHFFKGAQKDVTFCTIFCVKFLFFVGVVADMPFIFVGYKCTSHRLLGFLYFTTTFLKVAQRPQRESTEQGRGASGRQR